MYGALVPAILTCQRLFAHHHASTPLFALSIAPRCPLSCSPQAPSRLASSSSAEDARVAHLLPQAVMTTSSGKPLIYFLCFFVLLSLFSSKKVKNPESTDYLGKAQCSTFHVLFHTFGVLFQIFTNSYPIFMCNISEAESTIIEMNCLWRILFKSVNVSLITCTF